MKENTELWTMELLDRIKTEYNLESVDSIPGFVDNLDREVDYHRTQLGRLRRKYSQLEIEAEGLEEIIARLEYLIIKLTDGVISIPEDIRRMTGIQYGECQEIFNQIKNIREK